ncbi:MAG: UDP-glucose/GDP-mannose dehydrogenase family protein [Candidatus Eremiobacteraeota bacterium]|nr:UDP-glucose/GDP-mannose dehydrogenase family protein [Candidatus Eremiobacteraeota bacterium]
MDITIVGAGYVGLVSGACFAELGHKVMCIDNNEKKIEMLEKGIIPFYEPGLEELVKANKREQRLLFSTQIKDGVDHGLIIFIAVDTPSKTSGEADLSFVEEVSRQIAEHMKEYRLIVEKSTVPVQTGEWVMKTIRESVSPGVQFDVASNPEFLREGTAIDDFLSPDRVVLGVTSEKAATLLVSLYEPLNAPLLITDIRSAELIKHSANAYLAMKISFINSIANICDIVGADVHKVARGIGLDKRIGMHFLQAGAGYGGSCFPKDVSAFINISDQLGYDFQILKAVQKVNSHQQKVVVEKLRHGLGELKGKTVAVLGLAFKPNTDDLRNAPSLTIIKHLRNEGALVKACDPVALERAKELLKGIEFFSDPYEAARGADALIVVTDWSEFKHLDFARLKEVMKRPLIVDGRNIYDAARMRALGFNYTGIGRQ